MKNINSGPVTTSIGEFAYLNTSNSAAEIDELTFQVHSPGGFAGYTPPGIAIVEYYDPVAAQVVTKTEAIGGIYGPSNISVTTGSLFDKESVGMVAITVIDADNAPGLVPGHRYMGTAGQFLKTLGNVNKPVDGMYASYSFTVSLLSSKTTDIDFNSTYSKDFFSNLGISGNVLPVWTKPVYDHNGNLVGLDYNSCFPAGTPITLTDGSTKPIEAIRHGDLVLSHDKVGNLVPQTVTKLFTNTTDIFIRLTFEDGRDDLIATPGHHFLTETGDYMEIGHLAQLGGGSVRIVDTDGSIVTARAERIIYTAETAEMFEQAAVKSIAYSGNTVLKEEQSQGWKTYNFEVRDTHTYIARGVRPRSVFNQPLQNAPFDRHALF